jgi:hypothetical protein
VLKCYLAAILLAEKTTKNWTSLLPGGMPSDLIRDCEENKRMQLNMEARVG